MGTVADVIGSTKKHSVMQDTWGHLYPEPGSKHTGFLIVADSDYSGQTILESFFPTLKNSPMRMMVEHQIFNKYMWEGTDTVWRIDCTLHFFKTSNDAYLGSRVGRIIKPKFKVLYRFSE